MQQNDVQAPPVHGIPAEVPVERLLLDAENPRLASGTAKNEELTQREILRRLWTEMAVDEVALSMAANGYYPEERLLVVAKDPAVDDGKYVVIEGNRRLAAVLLLTDAKLRRELRTDLPDISPQVAATLAVLPVSIYPERQSLWSYLGFRHINGTRDWDAYSKAQYAANVYETYGVPLAVIADKIGDRHYTVARLYRGLKVLQQAEEQAGFDVEDRIRNKFYFSHLYTAVGQPAFQRFLGITADGSLRRNPVPRTKVAELGELMTWLYGRRSTNTQPVVTRQSPDLNNLRIVIASRPGLSALRSGYTLSTAVDISTGDERRFRESLTRAFEELRRAKGTVVTGYKGEADLLEAVVDIVRVAESIQNDMEVVLQRRTGRPAPS